MLSSIVRLHHVTHNIVRSSVPAARRFYGELLGLQEIRPLGDPQNERLIWFAVADQQLHLVLNDNCDARTSRHLAMLVRGFDDLVASLRESGVPLDPVKTRPDGSRVTWCYDPDGNRIELMEQ